MLAYLIDWSNSGEKSFCPKYIFATQNLIHVNYMYSVSFYFFILSIGITKLTLFHFYSRFDATSSWRFAGIDPSYTIFVSFPMTFSALLYKFLFTYYLSLIRFTEMLSLLLIWFLFYAMWLCFTFFVVCAYIRLNVETLKNLLCLFVLKQNRFISYPVRNSLTSITVLQRYQLLLFIKNNYNI